MLQANPLKTCSGYQTNYSVTQVRSDPTLLSVNQVFAGILLSVNDHLRVYSYEPTGLRSVACVILLLLYLPPSV